jgi:adhesin/invasin
MELSVMARNWSGITGNTETITTAETGNGTEGGNEGGVVIDPAAEPQVSGLKMSGTLEAGQTLTATYAFAANGGNTQDKSTYAWGYEGTTGSAVTIGETVAASGQVPARAITSEDIGKVMELSVQARNGADVKGNTLTVKSSEAITAGSPVQANSGIKTDAATYMVGDALKVTVTLRNSGGIAVTGQKAALTTNSVMLPNATPEAGSGWTDNEDGTYTATYIAETESTDNQGSLKLSGWAESSLSEKYAIMAVPELKDITVNGYTFAKDAGFPTTGFTGANFTLNIANGSASNYTWTANASWVSVDNGVVSFTGKGTKDKVIVTGTPKSGGSEITYSFTLNSWFVTNNLETELQENAFTYCSSLPNYSVPTVAQLTAHVNHVATHVRGIGQLWNEWGNLQTLGEVASAEFTGVSYWGADYYMGQYGYEVGAGFDTQHGEVVEQHSPTTTMALICVTGM